MFGGVESIDIDAVGSVEERAGLSAAIVLESRW